jgi:glutamine amidotransferase
VLEIMSNITIVDYGVGNLFSVRKALENCGANVVLSAEPDMLLKSDRLVLPGVGAFGRAISELQRLGLVEAIQKFAVSGKPLLGICLGMQLLFDDSEEFGLHAGLGLIPGRIVPIPRTSSSGDRLKIPHIGWASLNPSIPKNSWEGTVLSNIKPDDSVYFVHSFMAEPKNLSDRLANCLYGGHSIAAVVANRNIIGCQFHPEKSGKVGLSILQAFCGMSG